MQVDVVAEVPDADAAPRQVGRTLHAAGLPAGEGHAGFLKDLGDVDRIATLAPRFNGMGEPANGQVYLAVGQSLQRIQAGTTGQ